MGCTLIVRALDANGDWLFGKGTEDYKTGLSAIAQSIQTGLYSFLGDCFFSLSSGIDWWNLLGSKDTLPLNLAISATILNIPEVQSITQISSNLNHITRVFTLQYTALTILGAVTGSVSSIVATNYLLTESGDNLVTESGVDLIS